jgi:hypothetical protein
LGPAVTNREQRQALDHCELDQNAESGAIGATWSVNIVWVHIIRYGMPVHAYEVSQSERITDRA